jgi:Spy/CpxP family protein refolding chaperone
MTLKRFFPLALICSTAALSAENISNVTPAPTEAQIVERFSEDLQAHSAEVMAKGLTLTSEQAAKFWPLFEAYQKEQDEIVEGQIEAIQAYAANFQSLDDQQALAYVDALLERDQRVHDLRIKWLKKFQAVVPPKVAARAIRIERRLGIVTQVKLSSQIPLIR